MKGPVLKLVEGQKVHPVFTAAKANDVVFVSVQPAFKIYV